MLVDNGGLHGMRRKEGEIALDAGLHTMKADFFVSSGSPGMIVRMKGADTQDEQGQAREVLLEGYYSKGWETVGAFESVNLGEPKFVEEEEEEMAAAAEEEEEEKERDTGYYEEEEEEVLVVGVGGGGESRTGILSRRDSNGSRSLPSPKTPNSPSLGSSFNLKRSESAKSPKSPKSPDMALSFFRLSA